MGHVQFLPSEICIVGWSCRFPGAPSIEDYWELLSKGVCAISEIPADRWSLERFYHPRRPTPGRSYTWAAGVLPSAWSFDPSPFGISVREAEQMDPQQRLLLEVTWEAIEDAGIRPSSLRGADVGVYVGASSTDSATYRAGDPSSGDAHFATGNALSVLSNRLSHVFDLRGPSLTIDTACSSALVALHHAVEALNSRKIEMAIVAGVNILAAPYSFISFSQAGMLSPTGRCHTFSAEADGYVRGEGGAVLVLRRKTITDSTRDPGHGLIVATGVNSDGHTPGIALPSAEAQQRLLESIYRVADIDYDEIAFVEAHGTGTPAGDPIEAAALGRGLGRKRRSPLLIGSAKTNIGHLEPAAGLAGLIKALLALRRRALPPSINFLAPNPAIAFDELNLQVASELTELSPTTAIYAGVNAFGFGGTNAHALVAVPAAKAKSRKREPQKGPIRLLLSAAGSGGLAPLARDYAHAIACCSGPDEARDTARAASHRRERFTHRMIIIADDASTLVAALDRAAEGSTLGQHTGTTLGGRGELPVAFVFGGNGSQWPGMGQAEFHASPEFRRRFEVVDALFTPLAGWSLVEALLDPRLEHRLHRTSVAQPLIFATQVAVADTLVAQGLEPIAVVGHSVGEVAAAYACKALDLQTAVRVIHFRSLHQELAAHDGDMAVVIAPADTVATLISGIDDIELAAFNSPRAVAVSGTRSAMDRLAQRCNKASVKLIDLGLGYAFHSRQMAPVEQPLLSDLAGIESHACAIPFVSTVTGDCLPGDRLDATYWWHNVRAPVRFAAAIERAAQIGARYFVEISPKSVLSRHVRDCLDHIDGPVIAATISSDVGRPADDRTDPIEHFVLTSVVSGAQFAISKVFGPDPGIRISLPHYPWQQREFRFAPSPEAIGYPRGVWHPLLGIRLSDALEWRNDIDVELLPEYADHVVAGQAILPGAAFVEMALAAARQWLDTDNVTLAELEILKPLALSSKSTREIVTRISPVVHSIEISSRPRLSDAGWVLHVRTKVFPGAVLAACPAARTTLDSSRALNADQIYQIATASGLKYGPAFRLLNAVDVVAHGQARLRVTLQSGPSLRSYHLDPLRLDACFHGLFALFPGLATSRRNVAYIPVRFAEIVVGTGSAVPAHADIELERIDERSLLADLRIYAADGALLARLSGARFAAVAMRHKPSLSQVAVSERLTLLDDPLAPHRSEPLKLGSFLPTGRAAIGDDGGTNYRLILDAWATAAGYEIVRALADDLVLDRDGLMRAERLPLRLVGWLELVLRALTKAGLVQPRDDGTFAVEDDPLLPSSSSILASIATDYSALAAELLLATEVGRFAADVVAERRIHDGQINQLTDSALALCTLANACQRAEHLALAEILAQADLTLDQPLKIAVCGASSLDVVARVLPGSMCAAVDLVVDSVSAVDRPSALHTEFEVHRKAATDLVTATLDVALLTSNSGLRHTPDIAHDLHRALRPGAQLIVVTGSTSLFGDLVDGIRAARGSRLDTTGQQASAHDAVCTILIAAGFDIANRSSAVVAGFDVDCVAATKPNVSEAMRSNVASRAHPAAIVALDGADRDFVERWAAPIAAEILTPAQLGDRASPPSELLVVLPRDDAGASTSERIATRCLGLAALATSIGETFPRLSVVHAGALPAPGSAPDPVETATWAFCRTLANEHPRLSVRRVDVPKTCEPAQAARLLQHLSDLHPDEAEVQIGSNGLRAVRVRPVRAFSPHRARSMPAARLQRAAVPGQRLTWVGCERPAPARTQVEIEVAATGLNFRDVMWSLEMLPDDMLEDGFTGPSLGLECAGTIVRVGSDVATAQVGDRVVTSAPASFATHALVDERLLLRIPPDMSFEAAATIPVAFLTAYYALVTLARLEADEVVLIHGGAGAVGLAALQIARSKRARIIATAGSPAKRNLLKNIGVDCVLDSRSLSFANELRQIAPAGVDVALNSLAGAAMEQTLRCMAPFGRFIELGKRDYVENTNVGLRPFCRNLSYFGVDVDQLMAGKTDLATTVFADLQTLLHDEVIRPLPHTVLEASGTEDAFALMQRSGHIGKLVIRPPRPAEVAALPAPFQADPHRTHLVTGAFGGFGWATVRWLVGNGARFLLLLARSRPRAPEVEAQLERWRKDGIRIHVESCDVADALALEVVLKQGAAEMPALAGVIHAAMVLDDGLINGLTPQQLNRVLRPKVTGADNLDRLTRSAELDYFVLYSSVTTTVGNPGQASYVAANGYLEGLVRRRRHDNRPGLAVAFGPITDVGIIARDASLKAKMLQRHGLSGMTADAALDLLGEALVRSRTDLDLSVVSIIANDWNNRSAQLVVLRSPSHAAVFGMSAAVGELASGTVDLAALLSGDPADARERITAIVATRLASVIHARIDELDHAKPLSEMGLDSLMAFELAAALEQAFGTPMTLDSGLASLTITGLADTIIAQAGEPQPRDSNTETTRMLAQRHIVNVSDAEIETLHVLATASQNAADRTREGA